MSHRSPWHWVLYPATNLTSPIAELTEARDRKASFRLADASEASFTLNARHELATLPAELVTDLVLFYEGDPNPLFRGRLGSSNDDVNLDAHAVTFSAVDYLGLLKRRDLTSPQAPWTFTAQPQGAIVRFLIGWTQGLTGGNLGISATSATVPDTATARTLVMELGKSVGDQIMELGALENGFDFWVDGNLVAQLWAPERGTGRDLVCEYGSTVTAVRRTFDSSEYANAITVTGADGTVAQYATVADLATRLEGRFDLVESLSDIDSTTVLQAKANELRDTRSAIRPAYTCQMVRGKWRPFECWVGDTTWLIVDSGRLNVRAVERIYQIDVDLDDDGAEDVAITFGAPAKKISRRVQRMTERIARVERLGAV